MIQNTFCQIQRISPHGPLAFRSVCAENSPVFMHSPGSVNEAASRVEPPTQDVKYRRFSFASNKHFSIVCHNSCTGQTNAVSYSHEFEAALKGGVFLQNHRLHL